MKFEQVRGFCVVAPSNRTQYISRGVQFGITIKGTINTSHINKLGITLRNIICIGLLRQNHIIQRSENFICFELASKIRHSKLLL